MANGEDLVTDEELSGSTDPAQLAAALSEAGVEAVALTYVDNSGITRVKAVPTSRLEAAVSSGVGMSPVFDVMRFAASDIVITLSDRRSSLSGTLHAPPNQAASSRKPEPG